MIAASLEAGFINQATITRHRKSVDTMTEVIINEFRRTGPFDFGDRSFVPILRDEGMGIAADRSSWHLPPTETLFIQRKISGTALLCARLKAKVNVREILLDAIEAEGVPT